MKRLIVLIFSAVQFIGFAQSPLFIPPTLTGSSINLNVQSGVSSFYSGTTTPTYGVNGIWMAPTIIANEGDSITLHVTNSLSTSTTMHWHGLHVAAHNDGGPHQIINPSTTWSPSFKVRNQAATFWYHPHGENKTDLQVSRGIAGFFIVHDSNELALNLPKTYGVDDFPIVVQSKAFDILQQIAIATEMDTAIFVNGTLKPYVSMPSQIVRLRLLNGSSMRAYNFGFTANLPFKLIGVDQGLIDTAITLTRIVLSPGERVEILLDLQGRQGDSLFLRNYGSELPNGIYGASTVTGMGGATIPGYDLNPLNGLNYDILKINVIAATTVPVPITSIPSVLANNIPWSVADVNAAKNFRIAPEMMGPSFMVEGPFLIDDIRFNMDSINRVVYLNNLEKWRWTNNTNIAHPIHIHDTYFEILNINGGAVPLYERGKKDVVLVPPMQYVEFLAKFEDFADPDIPYMYHCHLLHHEDDGMMGSFVVIDTNAQVSVQNIEETAAIEIYPNPTSRLINIETAGIIFSKDIAIYNAVGAKQIIHPAVTDNGLISIDVSMLPKGMYFIKIEIEDKIYSQKLIVE